MEFNTLKRFGNGYKQENQSERLKKYKIGLRFVKSVHILNQFPIVHGEDDAKYVAVIWEGIQTD